ncbi:MAG: pilus assembly protein PilM [Fidelibacterota bacterium]
MTDSKEKESNLATNRLLDLLRSQQAETKPPPAERKEQEAKEVEEKTAVKAAAPEEKPAKTVPEPDKEESGDSEPTAKSILKALEHIQGSEKTDQEDEEQPAEKETAVKKPPPAPEKVTPKEPTPKPAPKAATPVVQPESKPVKEQPAKTEKPVTAAKPTVKELIKKVPKSSGTTISKSSIKTKRGKQEETHSQELLKEIQTPKPKPKQVQEEEIPPVEFDESLFSTLAGQGEEKKFDIDSYVSTFFQLFNESRHKVTIHYGKNYLRLLYLKSDLNQVDVEKQVDYNLPYKTEEKTIKKMDELITYALDTCIDKKVKKTAYGALYSQEGNPKTHILQTPELKDSELKDLVEWNAKKNMGYNPDTNVLDWEVLTGAEDATKRNIVIGLKDESTLKKEVTLFHKSDLKLRLVSTIPILLWRLFVHNYPDRKEGCYVLIHIGAKVTTLAVVKDHKLVFNREISVGGEDFHTAAMQRIVLGDEAIRIDNQMAKEFLRDYGIPDQKAGVIKGTKISLYKISIFLRPVVERITRELERSLNYFKKENSALDWQELLFCGIGATFPNLVKTLGLNLNTKVGLLNPVRVGRYVSEEIALQPDRSVLDYSLNFALATKNSEKINLLPKKLLGNYKYIFLSKVAMVLALFFIPYFSLTAFMANGELKDLSKNIEMRTNQWNNVSGRVNEYFKIIGDIGILNNYRTYLKNDRIHSDNQLKLLKLFSTLAPENIKLTSLAFTREVISGESDKNQSYGNKMAIRGFVQADPSVADIHLTNYRMKLETLSFIRKVDMIMDDMSRPEEGKLFFNLSLRF